MEYKIKNLIIEALKNLNIEEVDFTVEHPADLKMGDYSTNVAMVLSKREKTNPKELAQKIVDQLSRLNLDSKINKIDVAGAGFINFYLAPEFFADSTKEILNTKDNFGKVESLKGKKVLVEHSSPNLFKPFHIGHMMNNTIGESMVQIMKFSGAEVKTMSFPSDISLGVAKAVFIILEKYGADFTPNDIAVLGDAYVEGTKRFTDDESIHERVKEIADNLYVGKGSPELKVYEVCKKFNIEYFESITKRLGSHFDSYIYESEAGIAGKEIVGKNTPAVFTESEGAVVYIPDEAKKNLNTAVFINSQGNPTYEAKDLGLLKLKFERVNPNISIFITDTEQIPHFNIVLDAAEKINPEWVKNSIHVPHGRMSYKGQKMSSRLGGVPLATEMIDLVLGEVSERTKDRVADIRENAEAVAIGAIKFTILRTKPGQNINFDPDTSLSFEGDSGPYLQYTHARIQSLIEKGSGLGMSPNYHAQDILDIEKMLYRFPEIVERAITEYAPQYIVTYVIEVAHGFNSFYGDNQIIDEKNKEVSEHRLAIARATQIIIKNGLHLLGIQAPERM